ncbi:MAG: octanoyltransferase, partial [Gemmatimonadota bacterium]
MPEENVSTIEVRTLGRVAYGEALDLQTELVTRRRKGEIPDQFLLVEHPHVITVGTSSEADHILLSDEERTSRGIELFEVGRGGDVTYH